MVREKQTELNTPDRRYPENAESLRSGGATTAAALGIPDRLLYRGKEGGVLRRQRTITLMSQKTLY
jgi:hypothetical protein